MSAEPRPGVPGGHQKVPAWLLAILCFGGTLGMHILVPALPSLKEWFGAHIYELQLSISLYIIGLSLGQLLYGPLSDRYGRRPVLLLGMAIYTAASLAVIFAPDIATFNAVRFIQALGGCAGLVVGRAIARDISQGKDAARLLAVMNLMISLGPAAAPLLGVMFVDRFGWQTIFLFLGALGAANFLITLYLIPETNISRQFHGPRELLANYLGLLRSRVFISMAVGGSCATAALYAFTVNTPFIVVEQLRQDPFLVGICLALTVLGCWTGAILATILLTRFDTEKILLLSSRVAGVAALALLVISGLGLLTIWSMMICAVIYTIGVGIVLPTALALALDVDSRLIGSSAGLYGSIQFLIGALCTSLAGIGSNPAVSSALVLTVTALIAQVCFHIARR